VDIDAELVRLSNGEAKKRGVADRVEFRVQDVFKADISKATVVTLYLLPEMMARLRSKLFNELRPGTRVVSHDYHFDDWSPEDQFTWDVPEKQDINGSPQATVYLWIVPAKVAGTWQVEVAAPAAARFNLDLKQQRQEINGTVAGSRMKERGLTLSRLSGNEIAFAFPPGAGDRLIFRGRVSGEVMEGTVQLAGTKAPVKWTAKRVKPGPAIGE